MWHQLAQRVYRAHAWCGIACVVAVVTCGYSAASAATGCADGTREALVDQAAYPAIAGCAGTWTGLVGSASANSLCSPGWHVCSPAADPGDAALVKSVTYSQATSFGGCFAFNASQDFGGCWACDPNNGDRNDLAGMGTGCDDLYDASATSCLANGRVDARNGSDCAFIEGVTTGVVCCEGTVQAPAMSRIPLILTISLLLLAGLAAVRRRRDTTAARP